MCVCVCVCARARVTPVCQCNIYMCVCVCVLLLLLLLLLLKRKVVTEDWNLASSADPLNALITTGKATHPLYTTSPQHQRLFKSPKERAVVISVGCIILLFTLAKPHGHCQSGRQGQKYFKGSVRRNLRETEWSWYRCSRASRYRLELNGTERERGGEGGKEGERQRERERERELELV